jgi:hypothetical protein
MSIWYEYEEIIAKATILLLYTYNIPILNRA